MFPDITRYYVQVKEDSENQKAFLTVSNSTSILFMRYGIVRKSMEADLQCYSPVASSYSLPSELPFNRTDGKYLQPDNVPALPAGYAYAAFPLRNGYLYVYYETENVWAEYKITDALKLQKIVWDEKDYSREVREPKRNPATGRLEEYTGLPVGKNRVVWVAYSEVQWSAGYAGKVLTTAALREGRMQRVDVDKWKNGEKQDDVFDLSKCCVFAGKEDRSRFEQLKIKTGRLAKENKEEEFPEFFFMLHDPLGAADDAVICLQQEYEYLEALAACALTGGNPRYMRRDSKGQFPDSLDAGRQNEYEAAFSTGLTLYLSLFNDVGDGSKQDLAKYRRKLDLDRITAMLGVRKRAEQRKVIHEVREVLGGIVSSNYYQNVLFDYSENSDSLRLMGEQRVVGTHYGPLADLPHYHDRHLDLYNKEYNKEDRWRKFVADNFFGGTDDRGMAALLSLGWEYKKQSDAFQAVSYRLQHKDYDSDSIAGTAVNLVEKLLSNLSTTLALYGPFMGAKLRNEKLFDKINQLKMDRENLVSLRDTTVEKLNVKVEAALKKVGGKTRKIRKGRRAELSGNFKARIKALSKDYSARISRVDTELKDTKVRVFEFFKGRKKLSAVNNKAVGALGQFLVVMDSMNLGFAIGEVMKDDSVKNKVNVFNTSVALASSMLSLSTQSMRTLDLQLTRLLFKDVSIRLSTRMAWVGGIASAVVDGINAYERFNNRDFNAALFYALAAGAGAGVLTGAIASIGFAAAWGGPVAWACLAVGFFAGLIAGLVSDDDFELFLRNSVFGREPSPAPTYVNPGLRWAYAPPDQGAGLTKKLQGKRPDEVMGILYGHRDSLNKKLEISGAEIDMSKFSTMDGWLREFFLSKEESCRFTCFLIKRNVTDGLIGKDFQLDVLLDKLHFSCSFIIPRPAPVGVNCICYLYLAYKSGKSALIKISPQGEPLLRKDASGGPYRFSASYPEIHKKACELVTGKGWSPDNRWYDLIDRSRSCYILTYRIYTDTNEAENYVPYDQEWYVRSLPLFDSRKSGVNAYMYDDKKVLKTKPFEEFETLTDKHELIIW